MPVRDELVRRYVYNLAESMESLAGAMGGRVERRKEASLADHMGPTGLLNSATLLRPLTGIGDQALDAIESFYGAGGSGNVKLWSAWPTPDLRARGWELVGHPPLLYRPGDAGRTHPTLGHLDIVEVRDGVGIEDWSQVAAEGFPFEECLPYRTGSLLDGRVLADERFRFWVGYDRDRAVALGSLFVAQGIAQLFLGVTRPEARHRGYWHGLVRARLEAAGELPCAALFSDMSRPGAERLGFLPIDRFTLWRRERPAKEARSS